MILTGPAIRTAVKKGILTIEPFNEANINPNSYNYHLADSLLILRSGGAPLREVTMSGTGFVLKPGKVYLGSTLERMGSDQYVTLLLGRSSIGRLGIFVNITADLGHLGSCSRWTLELTVVQPVRVYPRMAIGQVSFWRTDDRSIHRYAGLYQHDEHPVANRDRRIMRGPR
jgi:dCTP deaminase